MTRAMKIIPATAIVIALASGFLGYELGFDAGARSVTPPPQSEAADEHARLLIADQIRQMEYEQAAAPPSDELTATGPITMTTVPVAPTSYMLAEINPTQYADLLAHIAECGRRP